MTLFAEPADVIEVAPPAAKARTRRAGKETAPAVALEALPATPKLPDLDLNALVEDRPETRDTAQDSTFGA